MSRSLAVVAVFLAVTIRSAGAAPVGTGALLVECAQPICCAQYDFAPGSYDVFGTPVDLAGGVGTLVSTNIVTSNYDMLTGLFAGTTSSVVPGVLDVGASGSFICGAFDCVPGAPVTFVGDVTGLAGSFALPAGLAYTVDGSVENVGGFASPSIPGCPIGAGGRFVGSFGFNAFENEPTPAGTDVDVSSSTTFFDPLTGTQVTVGIDANFAQVDSPGQMVVRAYSNAAGEVPGNFAAQVNGSCAVDPMIDCCADSDCPSGTCDGCYRAAYVDVTTTASVSGPITLCSQYPDADADGLVDGTSVPETRLRFLHEEAEVFVDRTVSIDPVANRICAEVASLSFFVVAADVDAGCAAAPIGGCRAAGKSLLLLKDAGDDNGDKLIWKWLKGAATSVADLGLPSDATDYTLCLYAGGDAVEAALPAGGGWAAAGSSGFKYQDASGTPAGVQKALLKSGTAGKAKLLVKGRGLNVPDDLAPPVALPLTVQLVNDTTAACWEAVFDSGDVIKNVAGQLKLKTE